MDKRYTEIEGSIEQAIFALLKRKSYDKFTVKDLCTEANINRSTFYAHYQDINDVMIKIESGIAKKIKDAISLLNEKNARSTLSEEMFIPFFTVVRDHKDFYKAFLRENVPSFLSPDMIAQYKEALKEISRRRNLNYTDREANYHLVFLGGGLRSMCKFWVLDNCKESPEEMAKILHDEYANNAQYVTN